MVDRGRSPPRKPDIEFRVRKELTCEFREQPGDPAVLLHHEDLLVHQKPHQRSLERTRHSILNARPRGNRGSLSRHYVPVGRVTEVWVVPRNGYVNRLQAWASAAVLAQRNTAQLRVCWEPEAVSPTEARNLFAPSVLADSFVTADDFVHRFGAEHSELPRYLSTDLERNLIVLAGHDRGEQAFMGELEASIAATTANVTLIIIAGGHFHEPTDPDPILHRSQFYEQIEWAPEIDVLVDGVTHPQRFLGAHIRGTDRALTAPRPRQITDALTALAEREGTPSIFVAADRPDVRDAWLNTLQGLGLEPWFLTNIDHDRQAQLSGISAFADWRMLGRSQAVVYPWGSSFGHEAAVATGRFDQSIGIAVSPSLQRLRSARAHLHNVATFPRRHWGGSPRRP